MRKFDTYLSQPQLKAKLFGIPLIIVGVAFLFINDDTFLKLGFSFILIGLYMIVMITERTVPALISNAQIKGHTDAVRQITQQLNLKGHALFLPKNGTLTEERVFIPLKDSKLSLPQIDNEIVFATGNSGTSLGISLPPSGLSLLREVEKETLFTDTDMEHIEEKLQTFVGMDILKSVSLKQKDALWNLTIEKPSYCIHDESLCGQYPCPSCSAVLTAISKGTNQKIHLENTVHNGKKTTFSFTTMR
jgi:hypothetical protein